MYYIKEHVDLNVLEKYGFKLGRDIPDNERCLCNPSDYETYWLIPMHPDRPDEVFYADEDFDQPIWSVQVQETRRLWIECVPSGTYHIDNCDMDKMFYALKCMIEDGIIEDDYEKEHVNDLS